MSSIQQKLKENQSRIRREKFLSGLDDEFSGFLSRAEFSSEDSCLRNGAFPEWDKEKNAIVASRGTVKNWNTFNFQSWQELIALLKRFKHVKDYVGWFFKEQDGPYFRISLKAFLAHIHNISVYAAQNEHYDFGWVCDVDDVGIIIGKNPTPASDKKFNISIWGL